MIIIMTIIDYSWSYVFHAWGPGVVVGEEAELVAADAPLLGDAALVQEVASI